MKLYTFLKNPKPYKVIYKVIAQNALGLVIPIDSH